MRIADYIARWSASPFGALDEPPWRVTWRAPELVRAAIEGLSGEWLREGEAAVHVSAEVEPGAVLKGPVVVGPRCFVSASALLRGGVFLDDDVIVGPSVELKTTFMFQGSKVAHLSFVGDSLLGAGVNVEAGAMIANYRNELDDKTIRIAFESKVIDAGVDKFGALVGDGARIGANAVIAPGAILKPGRRVERLSLIDQHPR
jgi:bifunctional N-acetylglucosamine-1-phosphate-uridyltransferase/glucosamine-1-phosphate-acetyltransferase GlmU-like protein